MSYQHFNLVKKPFQISSDNEFLWLGKKVLLIVDEERQRISKRFLKEIISWSQFGLNQALTIILAGQLEFNDVLRTTMGLAWQVWP